MKEQFIDKNFSSKSLARLDLVNMILDKYSQQGYDLTLRQLYYQLVARVTDSRYQAYLVEYGDSSWELDALEPAVLGSLVRDFVLSKRDDDLWDKAFAIELKHKKDLRKFADTYED